MATESKSKMNLGSWMQPSVDADGNPLKKAPAKPPKKDKVFSKAQENQILKALNAMDKDLGIDKLDDKKGLKRIFDKVEKSRSSSGSRSGMGGGGGMNPIDLERVPGKRPLKMKVGGSVKSSAPKMGKVKTAKPSMGGASKRADGIAMRGKTKGRIV